MDLEGGEIGENDVLGTLFEPNDAYPCPFHRLSLGPRTLILLRLVRSWVPVHLCISSGERGESVVDIGLGRGGSAQRNHRLEEILLEGEEGGV